MGDAESSELLWFIVGLVFMLAELALPGFVVIFFGIGAWVAALCAALGIVDSFNGQVAVFLISSILTLVLFPKQGKKYFKGRVSGIAGAEDALDNLKGQRAVALSDIGRARGYPPCHLNQRTFTQYLASFGCWSRTPCYLCGTDRR